MTLIGCSTSIISERKVSAAAPPYKGDSSGTIFQDLVILCDQVLGFDSSTMTLWCPEQAVCKLYVFNWLIKCPNLTMGTSQGFS